MRCTMRWTMLNRGPDRGHRQGHETYRDRMGVKTPFLERELLEEYAQQIGLE